VGAERLPPIPIPSFSAGGMSLTMPLIVEGLGNFAGRTRGPVKSAPTARVRDGYLATSYAAAVAATRWNPHSAALARR
jgi:hypothetical protein